MYEKPLRPGDVLRIRIFVNVAAGTGSPVVNSASVSGGGAPAASTVKPNPVGTAVQSTAAPFGFESFSDQITGVNGLPDTQAGDHPYETTVSFMANTNYLLRSGGDDFVHGPGLKLLPPGGVVPGYGAAIKDFVTDLPPGFVGDPQTTPKCPQVDLSRVGFEPGTLQCPAGTQIGVATSYLNPRALTGPKVGFHFTTIYGLQTVPVYNVVPEKGYPAQFAFTVNGVVVTLHVNVNQETNYGVRVIVSGIPELAGDVGSSVTFFGTPTTDPNFNNLAFGLGEAPAFLDNPTGCTAEPQVAKVSMDTWQHPGSWLANGSPDLSDPHWVSASTTVYPSITGCDLLQFAPGIEVTAGSAQADEPSGLTVDLRCRRRRCCRRTCHAGVQERDGDVAVGDVDLAVGGRWACRRAARADRPGARVAGVVSERVGARDGADHDAVAGEPLEGQVFLGTPGCDPCSNADAADGNMFHIYLEAEGAGVVIKQHGTIYANTTHGAADDGRSRKPAVPVQRSAGPFQGWVARGAGDTADLRDVHDDRRYDAVEQPDHAGRDTVLGVQRRATTATAGRVRR